jgi:tetratricopeptide (TPR) repeat protein
VGADVVDVAECRARVAESSGQGDHAAQQWAIVMNAHPTDRDARVRLIEAHIDAHNWVTATQIAQTMFDASPDDETVAYLLGSLFILDDAGQARLILRGAQADALIAALDEPASRVNTAYRAVAVGRVFLERDQLALAWRAFLEATTSNPNYSDGFAYLGLTYDALGDATLAAAFLDRALEINRNSAVALYLRGVYASRHGQWTNAQADLERAAQIDPGNASIAIALGRVLAEQGEYAQAAEQMGKAANLDPYDVEWQLALAELHIGRLIDVNAKGVPAARRAVELAPLDARAHAWLGWGLYLSSDAAQAEAELLTALRLDPMSARARLFLGNLYVNTGRIEDGRTELQRAVDLDPQGEVGARARTLLGGQ